MILHVDNDHNVMFILYKVGAELGVANVWYRMNGSIVATLSNDGMGIL